MLKPPLSRSHQRHDTANHRRSPHNPIANLPPPNPTTSTGARRWRTSTWRSTASVASAIRGSAHIVDTTAVGLCDDIDLAGTVRAHVQSTLSIPCQAYWTETVARACGEVRIRNDIYSCRGAVRGGYKGGGTKSVYVYTQFAFAPSYLWVSRRHRTRPC